MIRPEGNYGTERNRQMVNWNNEPDAPNGNEKSPSGILARAQGKQAQSSAFLKWPRKVGQMQPQPTHAA